MANTNLDSKTTYLGLAFVTGVIAGYVANLLTPENTKGYLEAIAKRVRKKVLIPSEFRTVKSLLPIKGEEIAEEIYQGTRSKIVDELAQTKVSWDGLNKRKYSDIAKSALREFVVEQHTPEEKLKTLRKYLQDDLNTLLTTTLKSDQV